MTMNLNTTKVYYKTTESCYGSVELRSSVSAHWLTGRLGITRHEAQSASAVQFNQSSLCSHIPNNSIDFSRTFADFYFFNFFTFFFEQ